ncbi:MAG: WYL domain-containing protein [Sinobacteraceae bacterium]|nr:WYL domain-containing protein [Nevskiaceae bacterium]
MARFEKLQEIFSILCRTREPKTLAALCDEMSASPATVKRLIGFLRDQRGVDIRYDREQGGYRLERSPDDPQAAVLLGLSGREISALLEVEALLDQIPPGFVRDETQSVRSRLGKVRRQALGKGDLADRVRLRMSQLRNTSADAFATVLSALRARKRLQFVYRSRSRDEEKARSASPLRLTLYRSNWYLAAWCHEREEMRVFSVDRISAPRCMVEMVYDPPADLIAAELDSGYGIFTGKADKVAVLRFNELAARWVAEEEWHPGVRSEPQPGGGVILRIPYKHEPELVMDILRHGSTVEVLGPASLRKTVADALAAAIDVYAER